MDEMINKTDTGMCWQFGRVIMFELDNQGVAQGVATSTEHRLKIARAMVKALQKELYEERGQVLYYCTVCGENPVDAENGFDTCDQCLREHYWEHK